VIFVSIFEKYFIMANFNELAEKPTIVEVEKLILSPGAIFDLDNLLNPFTIATEENLIYGVLGWRGQRLKCLRPHRANLELRVQISSHVGSEEGTLFA
jgi:hypothetical protein